MNFVESRIYYTHVPLSISEFNKVKKDPEIKACLDNASLYMIAKREVPSISVAENIEIAKLLSDYNSDEYVTLRIELKESAFEIDVAYILPPDFSKNDFISSLSGITVEDLFFYFRRNFGSLIWLGEIGPLVTYKMLYVGQCVDETLTQRFKAHHALQDMLIEEKVISRDDSNADELYLFPCIIKSNVLSLVNGDSSEIDIYKALTNDFDFGSREIHLDAEKALVHNMNPQYNGIKFLKYPKSDDGLSNTDANAFCYSISEFGIFQYENGLLMGCPNDKYASKIVGDAEGLTKIYNPGEDVTKRYFSDYLH